jgi:hypothetical protein
MTLEIKTQMAVEWRIMKSILKHSCGADIGQILEDVKSPSIDEGRVFEGVATLMETTIISFSLRCHDFIFSPQTSSSPLIGALKKSSTPQILIEEYLSYGWCKLAGLI